MPVVSRGGEASPQINTKQGLRTELGLCRLVLTTTKENKMSRSAMILAKHNTDNPLEFWVKTSNNGTRKAYYWHRRTFSISLDEVLVAEAQGIATRVNAPAF